MFLQIHTLTSYPASLLNRDDAGLAKRIPFGGSVRMRVSSQCLKRHWRTALHQQLKLLPTGIRSRHFFEREILPRVVDQGIPEDVAQTLTKTLMEKLIMHKSEADGLTMKQPVLFGKPEADYFVSVIAECAQDHDVEHAKKRLEDKLKTEKKNFAAMVKQAGGTELFSGLEGALFGRFVTSDILARSDAAVHVAHSMTIHPIDTEVDFFTVVDDLNLTEETGAAHAGDMELGAGVFYGYVVVDVPLLVSNFTGCDRSTWTKQPSDDVRETLRTLIRTIATVSPGAKLGATAPYAYSDFILLETGKQQPRTLANAFVEGIAAKADVVQSGAEAIARYLSELDNMYGATCATRALTTRTEWPAKAPTPAPLDEAIEQVLGNTFGAYAR